MNIVRRFGYGWRLPLLEGVEIAYQSQFKSGSNRGGSGSSSSTK
jgi:hypothetical protein